MRPTVGQGGEGPTVEAVEALAFRVPTDRPESDGTLAWSSTTLIVVRIRAGDVTGTGYTYAATGAAALVRDKLADLVKGRSALTPEANWELLRHETRNVGRPGVLSCALSAVDTALWDLKGKLLELPVVTLLGALRDGIPAYGSGGFTSYSLDEIRHQLGGWVEDGMSMVKMKVGRHPGSDHDRLEAAREAIGSEVELFVDANGAFDAKEALGWAELYADFGVTWFEEPVSSDDLEGLRLVREQGPAGMQVAAGEYGWDLYYFRDMLGAGAVDTLQVDVTRCGGFTPFLRVAALCEAHHRSLSAHTAPSLSTPVMCAAPRAVHVEYFHDHQRIESMLFDGFRPPDGGILRPVTDAPGHGLSLKEADAARWRVTVG